MKYKNFKNLKNLKNFFGKNIFCKKKLFGFFDIF
jgi:hypothetical protein